MLGERVAHRLAQSGRKFRVLVRKTSDTSALRALGAEMVVGDLRDPDSLAGAVRGADTIISTANSMARVLGGEKSLTIADVDVTGHADLIAASEAAGAQRFVFLSFHGSILESASPFSNAKRATETRLAASPIREVIVRPDMFQEVWLTPLVNFNWPERKFTIFGKGDSAHRYVAVDDVAAGVVGWALADDPPRLVEFGGPEGLTRNQAVDLFEQALGAPVKRRHVPRPALAVGATLLRRIRPNLASVMGQSLFADRRPSQADDAPVRALGVEPTPASAFIRRVVDSG
jgi:NADH dehydrogenase